MDTTTPAAAADDMQRDGAALIPYTGADALSTRAGIVSARTELERRRLELQRQQEAQRQELERQRRDMEAEFRRRAAELAEQMAPLRAQLEKMQEVLWTVDLYLGRDETLRLVRDGKPAPADTPITVRQKVLVMAEESLILMGNTATGMTADDIPEFIDWLCADDDNLNRVLPEQKGVVVLIPTRVQARSGNMYEDAARNAMNKQSYWLLRNGDRLYVLTVDPELEIRDRVLPRRREFVEVFDQTTFGFGTRREPVRPGSDEWFKLEKLADAKRRHYMRIMLVLQGLIDRTPVWHPLPEFGASFMSIADQDAGKIVLIQDDEDSIQLGELGETFAQYQQRLGALLRPGLRVIGNWNTRDFREMYQEGDRWTRGYHPRLHPRNVESYPANDVPHLIEDRRDGGFVIRYQRTEKVYKRNQPVPDQPGYVYRGETAVEAKLRASCVVKSDDSWVLPFDLVTIAELEKFLASREERSKHFLSMVPTIRAALAAKRSEAAQEATFRDLIGRLLIMEGAEADGIEALVDELVHWWKLAHTWTTPLNGTGGHEKKAADQILTEYRSRARAAADDSVDHIVAAGRAIDGVIAVARDRQGKWFAYTPSPGAHEPNIYLDVTPIRRNGTLGAVRPWQVLAQRSATALRTAWQAPEWATWRFGVNARQHLSEPERASLIEQARALAKGTPIAVTEMFDPRDPTKRGIFVYSWRAEAAPADLEEEATTNPFSWRSKDTSPIVAQGWVVDRTADSVALAGNGFHEFRQVPSSFGTYSSGSDLGDIPWWPDDATRYSDSRPRLIWSDEAMLADVAGYRDRCATAAKAKQAERRSFEIAAQRYVDPVMQLVRERQIAAVRERFEQDFGRDADDLWDAHLKSLALTDPIHNRDIWGIVSISLEEGRDIAGRTLDELADYAAERGNRAPGEWHRSSTRIDLKGYGDIVVVEPADADAQG